MKELTGKVACVTGGVRGLGRTFAIALANAGADVAIAHGRSEPAPNEFVAEVTGKQGVRCASYPVEITDESAVAAMVRQIQTQFGHIDILVNNAGTPRDHSFLQMSRSMWDEALGINLNGPFNITNAVLRTMVSAGWGRIINVITAGGEGRTFGQMNYTLTKGGLIAFTMTLARELARKGITVNAVAPGYTSVDATVASASEPLREQIRQTIPMGRIGEPEEIASVIAFLASPRASYITGQVIGVNGGILM